MDGIQWVPGLKPGVPQDGEDEWMPLYKKIQKAGKNIHMMIFDHPLIPHVYKKLDAKGLFVYTVFMSRAQADCYLPEFMGGNGGKFVLDIFTWLKKSDQSILNKTQFREYLAANNLEISKDLKNQIFKEVRKCLKGYKLTYL
ncbi:hypothetical protein ES703_125199 [subsurface metagenome]